MSVYILLCLLFLGNTLLSEANTVYVSDSIGSDSEGTGTASHPYKSLSAALNALSQSGAENITLLPGRYEGPQNTNIRVSADSNTVRIISSNGPAETFVGSSLDFRVFQVGGPVRNGSTSVTLPYHPVNGTDDASTTSIRDDSWKGLVPNLIISGLTIIGGSASKGGAVYVEGGTLKLLNCHISNGGHGSLYVKGISNVLVANTVFSQNGNKKNSTIPPNLKSGGAIFLEDGTFACDNCRFSENSALEHGGAIYAVRATLRFSNTNFTGNAALQGGGGAIFFTNTSGNSYIVNAKFRENQAIRGGAVFVGGQSKPQFVNCTFAQNRAKHIGGALLMADTSNVGIKRASFFSNEALKYGGAIAVTGESSLAGGLSFFHHNKAEAGGAIYTSGKSSLKLKKAIIIENEAKSGAGVMIADYSTPIFENSEISSNHASRGGAIYTDDSSRPQFISCRIKQNFASMDGGALYAAFDSAPDFHLCHFLENTSNLGDPFYMSLGAQDQIKFTLCSVYPHPNNFHQNSLADAGFPEELHIL
eukprot:c20364_g1_i1.p1 GENE.c20364_g1_i1~~c20364_g1_i1.p1  ORF type:complete len:533 (-),score=238.89 c20364_g1_i1:119-1717(-)